MLGMHQISFVVGFHLPTQKLRDGFVSDGNERASTGNFMFRTISRVLKNSSTESLFIGQPFLDLAEGLDFDFRMIGGSIIHDLRGSEDITTMNESDLGRKSGQECGFFHGRISTTNDNDFLISEKRTITSGAGRNSTTFLLFLTFCSQPDGLGSGTNDDGMSKEFLSFGFNLEGSRTKVDTANVAVLDFQAEPLSLRSQIQHHLRATDSLWITREIFDVTGEH